MARYRSIAEAVGKGGDAHPQKVADVPPTVASETPAPARPNQRPNRYAGKCRNCQGLVAEGSGFLGPKVEGKFTVEHAPGECNSGPTVTDEQVRSLRSGEGEYWFGVRHHVPDGKYTIVFPDSDNITFRVHNEDEWRDGRKGVAGQPETVTLLSFLSGPNNQDDYTKCGEFFGYSKGRGVKVWKRYRETTHIIEAVKVLIGDPKAAMAAYGLQSKRCGLCNRELTVKESIEAGIGPVCATKF